MKRIMIIGCPGSGKSTLSAALKEKTGLPLFHLDRIWWKDSDTHIGRDEFDVKLAEILALDSWIIDGDYSRTMETRMRASDTVIFLDYGTDQCLQGIKEREGTERDDCPLTSLNEDFRQKVLGYRETKRPAVLELLDRYRNRDIHIFTTREEARGWLDNLQEAEDSASADPYDKDWKAMTVLRKRETIETERLMLRSIAADDADRLIALFMDPAVNSTFMVPEFATGEECRPLAEMFTTFCDPDDPEHFVYGIYLEDVLIGFVNECAIEDDEIEIGYVISPACQGKGYATEAFRAAIEELRRMGYRRVTAGYFEENPASRRVMEKCGLQAIDKVETGMYRGAEHRCLYCAIDL